MSTPCLILLCTAGTMTKNPQPCKARSGNVSAARRTPPPFPALSPSMPHGMGHYGTDHTAGPPVRFLRTQVPSAAAVTHSRSAALVQVVQVRLSLPAQHKMRTTLVGHAMTGRRQCCTCASGCHSTVASTDKENTYTGKGAEAGVRSPSQSPS